MHSEKAVADFWGMYRRRGPCTWLGVKSRGLGHEMDVGVKKRGSHYPSQILPWGDRWMGDKHLMNPGEKRGLWMATLAS